MKMEKRIFRVLMLTVLLVFLIMILMGVVQSVYVSHVQRQYLEELQESGMVIAEEYRSLADKALENLAARKASDAEEVYRECCRMIEVYSVAVFTMSGPVLLSNGMEAR